MCYNLLVFAVGLLTLWTQEIPSLEVPIVFSKLKTNRKRMRTGRRRRSSPNTLKSTSICSCVTSISYCFPKPKSQAPPLILLSWQTLLCSTKLTSEGSVGLKPTHSTMLVSLTMPGYITCSLQSLVDSVSSTNALPIIQIFPTNGMCLLATHKLLGLASADSGWITGSWAMPPGTSFPIYLSLSISPKGSKLYPISIRAQPKHWNTVTEGELGGGKAPEAYSSYCWTQGLGKPYSLPQKSMCEVHKA